MIAFKPFLQAKESERPPGVPLDFPWLQVTITEGQASSYRQKKWVIMTDEDYAAHVVNLEENRLTWELNTPQILTEIAVRSAMAFGQNLITEYGAKNTLRGYTAEDVASVATTLSSISMLLSSGALYTALAAITALEVTSLVTQPDKDEFIAKISAYLGLE